MNRIDRISAILIQLQSHSLVKAQQISERFNISIRTVYRDIRTLEEAGIPIIGNPGIGYSLAEGFKLSPLMFTQKEALSFLIAEKLVHELTDSNSNEHYKSGIEKIRSVMRFADKNMLETMEKCMSVLDTYKSSTYKPDILLLILQSIYQKRIIEISYLETSFPAVSLLTSTSIGIVFPSVSGIITRRGKTRNVFPSLLVRIDASRPITPHTVTLHFIISIVF